MLLAGVLLSATVGGADTTGDSNAVRSAVRPDPAGGRVSVPVELERYRLVSSSRVSAPLAAIPLLADGDTMVAHLRPDRSLASIWHSPADVDATWHLSAVDEFGSPRVFRVLERAGSWLHVQVPVRPNEASGWIRLVDVELTTVGHRIEIDLSERTLTVFDGEEVVVRSAAAIGRSGTPTPTGSFYLRSAFAWDPDSVYGPYVLALSAFSESIETINGGDAVVAIHGTQRPDQLGQAVSLGCVRLDNDSITELAGMVAPGTPVDVVP